MSFNSKAVLMIIASIVLIIVVIAVVKAEPWHSQRYKDCRASADYQGYRGATRDAAIKFCVDTQ